MGLFGKSKSELLEWQNIIAPNTPKLMWNEKQLKEFTSRSVKETTKMIQESMNLCNITKKVDIFFKRYAIVIEQLTVLSRLEKFVRFNGDKPTKSLNDVKVKKQQQISLMIDRVWEDTNKAISELKTDSAKAKKVEKFIEQMDKFSQEMDETNIAKYQSLFKKENL